MKRSIASRTSQRGYLEDFEVGARMRHARRTTISEGESHLLTKVMMNTADGHFNAQKFPTGGPFPNQLVFGLLTGSMVTSSRPWFPATRSPPTARYSR
jgi:acyl dehydratase